MGVSNSAAGRAFQSSERSLAGRLRFSSLRWSFIFGVLTSAMRSPSLTFLIIDTWILDPGCHPLCRCFSS